MVMQITYPTPVLICFDLSSKLNSASQLWCEIVDGSKYSHGAVELACRADVCKPSNEIIWELPNICLHCKKMDLENILMVADIFIIDFQAYPDTAAGEQGTASSPWGAPECPRTDHEQVPPARHQVWFFKSIAFHRRVPWATPLFVSSHESSRSNKLPPLLLVDLVVGVIDGSPPQA